jgi:ribonuclease HI
MIFTDGGSRGNPGPAAYAYVIKRTGESDIEEKCYLGQTTNNIAEYTGLIKALEHARELGGRKLLVHSDSELMVKQMNGLYKVKNEGLRPLYQQATALRKQFESVTIKHIYREQNEHADALCNEAMDNPRASRPRVSAAAPLPTAPAVAPAPQPEPAATKLTALIEALEILKQNAERWAKTGDATEPAPTEVLQQIWKIFRRDAGVAD